MRAVISVSDKTGIEQFGRELEARGVELFSTGGTLRTLQAAGVAARSISELTSFPEILDGRVKTLHPAVHGGILHRRDRPEHLAQLAEHGIQAIDLVVVNLYPFRETVGRPGVKLDDALENIDIGGPAMLRAAAKNFPYLLVVVDPADYERVLSAVDGRAAPELRRELAAKAFAHTAAYDSVIAAYLRNEQFPITLPLAFERVQALRYGENPHQEAAFYKQEGDLRGTIAAARQLQGKELSFNNILDADAALQIARAFDVPTVTIVKHSNPCGLASDDDLVAAHVAARAGDPVSAFGGIVGINRPVDGPLARAMERYFYEVIVAPAFDAQAREMFSAKANLRLLEIPFDPHRGIMWDYRRVSGGLLMQSTDDVSRDDTAAWRVVSARRPTGEQLEALRFAWKACAYVKSNAIVLAQGRAVVGVGAGQPSRVDAVRIAVEKAGERAKGSVLASDAFFPKPDGVERAAAAGVTAIVQPGGSQADAEICETADRLGLVLVFTGRRHFRH